MIATAHDCSRESWDSCRAPATCWAQFCWAAKNAVDRYISSFEFATPISPSFVGIMATTDQRDTGSTTASTSCPSEPSLKDTQRQEASIDKDNVPSPSYPLAEDAFAALLLRCEPVAQTKH